MKAGDIVILPHGDAHLLGNGSPEKPVDSLCTFAKNLADGLKLGAGMLLSTEESVAEVAEAVVYCSEAAFNRAFKRELDSPPAQFRRNRKVPLAQHSQEGRPRV